MVAQCAQARLPARALACPNCKDAIVESGEATDEEDPLREARAYNRSIYLMVGMPYLLLTIGGFAVYRGLRATQKKTEKLRSESNP